VPQDPHDSLFGVDDPFSASAQAQAAQSAVSGTDSLFAPDETANRALTSTLRQSSGDAARAERILKLQGQTGLPAAVIDRNLDDIEKQANAQDFNAEKMRAETPALAAWLQEEPQRASLKQDDLAHMGALEYLFTAQQSAFKRSVNAEYYSDLRFQSWWRPLTKDEQTAMQDYKAASDMPIGDDSWWRKIYAGFGGLLGQQRRTAEYAGKGYAVGATAGIVTAASLGPGAVVGGITVPGMAIGGATVGAQYGMMTSTFQQEAVAAYDELEQAGIDAKDPIDPRVLKAVALGVGAANTAIEMEAQNYVFSGIPALRKISRNWAMNKAKAALANPSRRAAIAAMVKQFGKNFGVEVGQEVWQQINTIGVEELGKVGTDVPHRTLEQGTAELVNTAISAAQEFALYSAVGPAWQGRKDYRAARAGEQLLDNIGNVAKDAKLLKSMPQESQAFLARAAAFGTDTVYAPLPVWNEYWEKQGQDPAQVATDLTGSSQAYDDATTTTNEVAIPIANWAVRAAAEHSDFGRKELRYGENKMNAREANEWLDELRAQREAEIEAGTAQPIAPDVQGRIAEGMAAQFEAAGRDADEAHTQGHIFASQIMALSMRYGIDPEAMAARYMGGVTGQAATAAPGAALSQAAHTQADEALSQAHSQTVRVGERDVPVTLSRTSERHGEQLVMMDVTKADESFAKNRGFYVGNPTQSREGHIGTRYEQFGQFIQSATSMHASEMSVNRDGHVDFANGRHRWAYLRDQGVTQIPVAMDRESIANAIAHGLVTPEAAQQGQEHAAQLQAQRQAEAQQHADEQASLRDQNFRQWFGESTVTDKDGAPLVMYHGTHATDITAFNQGSYFTSSPEVASLYAERTTRRDESPTGSNVMPVFLSIKNPATRQAWFGALSEVDGDAQAAIERLKAQGFDGVRDGHMAIPFDATQIKSAIANEGTFDPTSPNILHQGALPTAEQAAATHAEQQRALNTGPAERLDDALLMSTRKPSTAATTPIADVLLITNLDALAEAGPDKIAQAAAAFRSYQLLTPDERAATDDNVVLRAAIDAMKRNLRALWDRYPEEWRNRAKLWYVGANRIANELSLQFGYSVDAVAGVLAALSPQMDWFRNVSLAERVIAIVKKFDAEDARFTQEHYDQFEKRHAVATAEGLKDIRKAGPLRPARATVKVGDKSLSFTLSDRASKAKDELVRVDVARLEKLFTESGGVDEAQGAEIGDKLEAPEVTLTREGTGRDAVWTVTFTNGRALFQSLRDQGVETVPVALSKDSIKQARKKAKLLPTGAIVEPTRVRTPAIKAKEAEYLAERQEELDQNRAIIGRMWSSLPEDGQARFLRMHDELHNLRRHLAGRGSGRPGSDEGEQRREHRVGYLRGDRERDQYVAQRQPRQYQRPAGRRAQGALVLQQHLAPVG
jgi:hypothetical protein